MKKALLVVLGVVVSTPVFAAKCNIPDSIVNNLQAQLTSVAALNNGGLFSPNRMWSAVVDRQGVLCSVISNSADAWPGSRAIAIAKASTANDFSNNKTALSTARLYSLTQPANTFTTTTIPAGSLYGLNNSNPFNPGFLAQDVNAVGSVPGGIITFGGGVPLYQNGQVIGGLGLSGDTACADHAIAYRMRQNAGLAPQLPITSDNIDYLTVGEPPHDFKHPHCVAGQDITPTP